MELIRAFSELTKDDAHLAGGKGASLGEMTRASVPVPPGFVILSNTFDRFIREADLIQEIESILDTVKHEQVHTVESASERIQGLILNTEIPHDIREIIESGFKELDTTYVAVRSSATAEDGAEHAWAGQLESYLNTTEANILENIRRCWASLFTPRAIFYRFEKNLHTTDISVAVVVQKMVDSEISGIAFSVHPVTEDPNQLIIEAGFGLGEAIVSGQITPDSYVVEKEPRRILDKNVYTQTRGIYRASQGGNEWKEITDPKASSQVLSDDQILELAELILRIETHYKFPCDIEWAFEQGRFYIVQSRPITTLQSAQGGKQRQQFHKAYTRDFSIIMQEAWFYANKEGLMERLGLDEYPHNPPYIYFMKDGVEEVWENKRGNEWLYERLCERLETDSNFFNALHKRYYEELSRMEVWWQTEINTLEKLEEFVNDLFPATADFVLMYGSTLSESLPPKQQKQANEFREKDKFFAECNLALERALKNIYPELGTLVLYITREELGQSTNTKELREREKGFVLIPGIFCGALSFDGLVQKFPEYQFNIEKFDPNATTFKGQSAYKGNVTGKVRILMRKDQVGDVEEGEIIVSPMTTPEMVAGMKKAAAFVTDEGGITCHAAIIAREMQKPCIIGTKVATQVLKNGEEVEVDANNGIVRIQRTERPSFEKVFARDFCMIALEIAALSEKRTDKEWMTAPNPNKPYMLIERTDGTSNIWYNKQGIEWTNETLLQRVKANKNFLKTVEEQVREGVVFIRPLYEKQEAVDRGDLIRFIDEFLKTYSWIEAMWWIKSMESEDVGPGHEGIVKLREETETLSAGTEIVIRKSLQNLYPELGILSSMIRLEELRSGMVPSKEELQSRLDGFTLIDGELELKTLDEVAAENDLILDKNAVDFETTEIKGEIAYRGKVRGRVCRVMGHTDFGKIKEGEILVSPMTMVDFLPEMKKAAAFVTDEGGITCHAAIVAREMKKPCVIGTQVATTLLKDGDEVEIDADNGVVRILKSNRLSANDYVRMFANKSFYYLFTDVFLTHYRALGVICAQDGDTWMSFLPKTTEKQTLEEGAQLYLSKNSYSGYKKEFEEYITSSTEYFEKQLQKETLSEGEVEEFFAMAAKHFSFYSKTEFFYSDKVDQEKMIPSIQEFDELKLNGRAHLNKVLFEKYVPGLITKLSEQYSVSKEHLFKYSVAEVVALSGGGAVLPNEEVEKRNILFASKEPTIFGDEALDLVHSFHASYRELSNTIKGTIAYKGKVRGRARVLIPDFSDFSKVRAAVEEMDQGEILVTETTAPEVIAACKKAAAIITNQGGMLSHAAIVARELKIPCIIGTDKDVVLNIQTGDELEVDADNGLIHILK